MKNNRKFTVKFNFFFILAVVPILTITACDIDNHVSSAKQEKIIVETTEGKLTVTGLDNFNDCYVVAFGHNWNYEYLYAAEKIDSNFVFSGGKVTNNKVILDIWKYDFIDTLIDYKDTGNFTFLVYVLNKREFKKAEEYIIGDYIYKGKPKPKWLEIVGLIRGNTLIDGICEAEFAEMQPL